jgi:RHS repeat-associated protein
MAISDLWGGPFAEQLRGVIRHLQRQLEPWVDHLLRFHGALDQAASEADMAVRVEAAGGVPTYDIFAALAPWKAWPAVPPPLPAGWQTAGPRGGASFVYVYPDRARQLVTVLRQEADELRMGPRRIGEPLAPLGIDPPTFYELMAAAAEEVAAEVLRRVEALEEADRRTAGTFATVGERLGFPGSLAPPADFDRAELAATSPGRPSAATGPGRQPTQAKEADPVSTSTGNYWYQAVDLVQPARGFPVVFARTYNSLRAATAGPLGFGWSHTLGVHLVSDSIGVTVSWDDGHEDHHVRRDITFVPPAGVFDRLRAWGDGWELATRAKVAYCFNPDGRLAEIVDRSGNRSTLDYDDSDRLAGFTDASGLTTRFEHDDGGRITAVAAVLDRRWTYTYSKGGDLITVTDPEGGTTTFEYDGAHRLVSITDAESRPVVRNIYDPEGRLVQQDDGAGGHWRYAYEPGKTVVRDPLGVTKTFEFDDLFRTTAVIDVTGGATRLAWDPASNLVAATDATQRPFRFAYDARGNLTSAEGPGAAPVSLEWDNDDNITAVVSAEGHQARFSWDEHSRPVRLSSPAGITTTIIWTPDGLPEAVVEGDGGATRYGFDQRGHLASVTDPLGAVTRVESDAAGRPVAEVHPGGARTTFAWDRVDRLTSVTDAAGGVTTYAYDRCGRLESFIDPRGRTTRYAYEGRGLLASVVDPLGRETIFDYDNCGRLAARTDPRGLTVSFSHDPAGRLVGIEAPDMASITYEWDAAGRLISMTDGMGTTAWELDEAGRPRAERRPGDVDLVHGYDSLGRRQRLELRRGETTLGAWDYGFDPDGRIVSVLDPAGGETLLGYDPVGRLVSTRHPNRTVSTVAMDLVGQPVGVTVTGPNGQVLEAWANTFDTDGNLVRCGGSPGDTNLSPNSTTFVYDVLGRVVGASGPAGSASYAWDATSNRITALDIETPLTATFDAADQIATTGPHRYRHDGAGNLVERSGGAELLLLSHDALGRVTQIRLDGRAASFAYDGLGRRVTRQNDLTSITRVYDGLTVVAELADGGDIALETAAGLLVLNRTTPSGTRYVHPDANTNVAVVTDETGLVVARSGYAPFGTRSTEGDSGAAGPLGFCGALGVREEIGGLLDMRARFYDPALGRFTSPDPWPAFMPEPITLNRYLYALGDPISQVDPYGLFCLTGKNDKGKCRGLKDVANRVAEPLGTVSTVATGVAAVMAGITVVCPLPCGPITGTAAAVFEGVAMGVRVTASVVGAAATLSDCVGSGVSSFGCVAGAASTAVSSALGFGLRVGELPLGLTAEIQRFAGYTFGLFLGGAGHASERMRK